MPRDGFKNAGEELVEAERQLFSLLCGIKEWMALHNRRKGVPEREAVEKFTNLKLAIGFAEGFLRDG